ASDVGRVQSCVRPVDGADLLALMSSADCRPKSWPRVPRRVTNAGSCSPRRNRLVIIPSSPEQKLGSVLLDMSLWGDCLAVPIHAAFDKDGPDDPGRFVGEGNEGDLWGQLQQHGFEPSRCLGVGLACRADHGAGTLNQ